jgi:phosphatidylglycerophosphate synthase
VLGAALYLPDAESAPFALRIVAGRALALRAAVAAARAGAGVVAIPSHLREPGLEAAIAGTRGLAGKVRWLTEGERVPAGVDAPVRWLLVPASALIEAATLRPIVERPPGHLPAVLAGSVESGMPLLLASPTLVVRVWRELTAGTPLAAMLAAECAAGSERRPPGSGVFVPVRRAGDMAAAERVLFMGLGVTHDTGLDRLVHRRGSLLVTRLLLHTRATPNQVSLASLGVGCAAVWALWNATPASAVGGVLLYALATVLDHSDGELARLTFQESPSGAQLDWAIDTFIHTMLVLALCRSSWSGVGGLAVGALGATGIALSAWLARSLPDEANGGQPFETLKSMGSRDPFYALLGAFVILRAAAPALLPGLAVLVALGSHGYWITCALRLRRPARVDPTR